MKIVKVVELMAESPESWEAAAQVAVTEAARTLKNIQSVYIKEFQANVDESGQICNYRVNAKISFTVKSED